MQVTVSKRAMHDGIERKKGQGASKMTKERLEELIKQEVIVYTPTSTIRLRKNDHVCSNNEILGMKQQGFYLVNNFRCFLLDKIYETKEQAEWHCKNDTERTERFEPPMWEDIDNVYEFLFIGKNGHVDKLSVEKKGYKSKIYIMSCQYIKPATKENYEKACEIVRDLFKGK